MVKKYTGIQILAPDDHWFCWFSQDAEMLPFLSMISDLNYQAKGRDCDCADLSINLIWLICKMPAFFGLPCTHNYYENKRAS